MHSRIILYSFALNKCLTGVADNTNTADVRGKIIDVSRELFIKNGFRGTTVRDIAAAADVSVAMVNYYFQSKHKLFETIFEESFDMLTSRVFEAIDSDLPFFDMLRKWVYSYYDVMAELPSLPAFVLTEITRNPDMLEERLRLENPYQVYAKLAIRINEEVKNGVIRDISLPDFLLNILSLSIFPFVLGPVAVSFLNFSRKEYEGMLESHKEDVVEFIINAIKA